MDGRRIFSGTMVCCNKTIKSLRLKDDVLGNSVESKVAAD